MQFFLLIHGSEALDNALTEAEMGHLIERYGKLTQDMESAGVLVGSHRLRPVSSATTVRVREGEALLTDGPFAETKEQFGGYYLIDVPTLDDAVAWAKKIPCAETGCIEVRPVWEMSPCKSS